MDLLNLGTTIDNISVTISYRIIELFSAGLYSSPNKAFEELICNQKVAGSNPAGATIRTQTPQGIAVFFISRGTNVNSIRGIFGEKC